MDYAKWVNSKAKKLSKKDALTMAAMGLAGESGEVVDELKKHIFAKKPLNKEELIKEAGDTLWYLQYLINLLGSTMEEVQKVNMEKLNKRYEKKYTNKASRERKDVK